MSNEEIKSEIQVAQTNAERKQKEAEARAVTAHILRCGGEYGETNEVLREFGAPEVTPETHARARRRQLMDDPGFVQRYMAGERQALDQMGGLDFVIAAGAKDPTKLEG